MLQKPQINAVNPEHPIVVSFTIVNWHVVYVAKGANQCRQLSIAVSYSFILDVHPLTTQVPMVDKNIMLIDPSKWQPVAAWSSLVGYFRFQIDVFIKK